MTPLHVACYRGYGKLAKLLVSRGARLDAVNKVRCRAGGRAGWRALWCGQLGREHGCDLTAACDMWRLLFWCVVDSVASQR